MRETIKVRDVDLQLKPESLKVAATHLKERERERETIAQRSISLNGHWTQLAADGTDWKQMD